MTSTFRTSVTGFVRRRSTKRIASGTSLALVAGTLVILAVSSKGTPITDVDLNDGSVWVTNSTQALIGRLNPQVKALDLGVPAADGSIDVMQNGTKVLLDQQASEPGLKTIDVANAAVSGVSDLPSTATAEFGDDTVAVADTVSGSVWIRSTKGLAGFAAKKTTPADFKAGKGVKVAVSPGGMAWALDVIHHRATRLTLGNSGVASVGKTRPFDSTFSDDIEFSVIGDRPVVLDRKNKFIEWPGHGPLRMASVDLSTARLQESSQSGAAGYLATRTGIVKIDFGGSATVVSGLSPVDGSPAAPLVRGGCVHTAWADPDPHDGYKLLCSGQKPMEKVIPEVDPSADLVFRTNRKVVVLNDTITGDSWLVQNKSLDIVKNWNDVNPNKKQPDQKQKPQKAVDRTDVNHPPKAVADNVGARAGQQTIIPVTANDQDPDGDIVTVRKPVFKSGTRPKSITVVGKDTQVQVDYPKGATGTTILSYAVTDGRENGISDPANITIRLHGNPESDNAKPRLRDEVRDGTLPPPTMTVGRGQANSIYVMPFWTDPDGDDLLLRNATTKDGGTVEFRADGTVTFHDSGNRVGLKTIDITMFDGLEEATGKIDVNVVGASSIPPELVPDRVVGVAGTRIQVEPLLNDSSPDGTPLQFDRVLPNSHVDTNADPKAGTFTALASKPGTYYLNYQANNNSATQESFVRVDVLPPPSTNRPPIAVKDEAVLPPGGTSLVDILANDYDPDNDVLVVQRVDAPDGLKAVLIDKHLLRIEATGDLVGVKTIHYTVSDGTNYAFGSVVVLPGKSGVVNRPPTAVNDTVTVRAGSVATIPVLANDSDPDGDDLSVYQEDLTDKDKDLLLFVSGDNYRVRAPQKAGTYRATYGIRDTSGLRASAEIIVKVLPDTPVDDHAPRPAPIIDRTIEGQTLRVRVNTQGADPDGDAVSFKGVAKVPTLGRIVGTGLDYVDYQPYSKSYGTDSFQLTVADKYGKTSSVDVRVGVAPRADVNQAPVALDDNLLVRPDRTIQYNVLTNDLDPDGDPMTVEGIEKPDGVKASISDGFVEVTVPKLSGDGPAKTTVGYTITDSLGGFDSAFLAVTASKDAPEYPPSTRDDTADVSKIAGKHPGDAVNVDVLDNDGDLDGSKADLHVSIPKEDSKHAQPTANAKAVRVTLTKTDQVLAYEVTDGDGNSSYGFIFVAGTNTVPPALNPKRILPIKVEQGSRRVLKLDQYVVVRAGHRPTVTFSDTVKSVHSTTSQPVLDHGKSLLFVAPKDFVGLAAITFEVTDGNGPNDNAGLKSLLTIPIDVTPRANVKPTIRSVPLLVERDGRSATIDLRKLVTDPNAGDRDNSTFTLSASGDAIDKPTVKDGVLKVAASGGAHVGGRATVNVTVRDPGGLQARGTVDVRIVSSTRPTVKISTIQKSGKAGKPTTVDIAKYATNPFPNKHLRVSGLTVESGEAETPLAEPDGTKITVTPKASSAGVVTVKFTVNDYLNDPSRAVVGRLKVAVAKKPDAPSRPTVSSFAAKKVVLTWAAPNDNGSEITDYEVTGKSYTKDCHRATTCTLDGLNPSTTYTFRVRARNVVNWSKFSPPSAPVTPDTVPDRMDAPTAAATKKDGELKLSWTAPNDDGSAITSFDIHQVGSSIHHTASPGARTALWTGLTNGTPYRFEITAINKAKGKQDPSPQSTEATPFGKPLTGPTPHAVTTNDGASGGKKVTVSWDWNDNPSANGDPLTGFVVTESPSGHRYTPGADARSLDLSLENGTPYTFTVAAVNHAGAGKAGPASTSVNPYGKSTIVRGLTRGADKDHAGSLTFTAPADDGGRSIDHYDVASSDGCTKTFPASATSGDACFTNNSNSPLSVTVTPVTKDGGTSTSGDAATVGGFRPFGPPNDPSVQATPEYMSVHFTASSPAPNGRPVDHVEFEGGGPSKDVHTNQGGDQVCVNARTVASDGGGTSPWKQFCGTSQLPHITVSKGAAHPGGGNYVHYSVDGFAPGTHTSEIAYNGDWNWCGNTSPCDNTRSISVGSDGRGTQNENYWWNNQSGTVSIRINGVVGSLSW
jgi:hypothetical protein